MHMPSTRLSALNPCAKRPKSRRRSQNVFAFQQAINPGFSDSQTAQHNGPMGDGFVTGNSSGAGQGSWCKRRQSGHEPISHMLYWAPLTLACRDAAHAQHLQHQLTTRDLRIYSTIDVIGAELGGALKNVVAIACGAVIGAGLGESARAAVMTRGFAEMVRLAEHKGADPRTLAGLSGFGDLALTCASTQSRNYSLGLSIGSGTTDQTGATVEGVATAQSVSAYARTSGLDLPITQTVAALVTRKIDVAAAIKSLMARPLKEE